MVKKPIIHPNPIPVRILIMGQCASKSNSRRIVFRGRKPRSIKSVSALEFCESFARQCPVFEAPMLGDVKLECTIYYRSGRSDLDDTLVCDMLQKCGVIGNDRQIKNKILKAAVDKDQPRVEITLSHMADEDYPDNRFMQAYLKDRREDR